eukprot:TRINITY_DN1016_c1_g2_i1.p1 TRINITY_DN1016_c1_g2~~TRINITY_DN1016_c1_g2_i1.p1  ORF type:complete len:514 (+),score=116.14 TRINITY_DN1016_c1_g2_i1:33-1544(+)
MGAKYKNLCSAAYYGDLKLMKKLVEGEEEDEEEDPEKKGDRWRERVNEAGYVTTCKGIKERDFGFGFDVIASDDNVFKYCFKPSAKSSEKASPLHWAVLGDEIDAVWYLLRKGAATRVTCTPFDASPRDVANYNKTICVFQSQEAELLLQTEAVAAQLDADLAAAVWEIHEINGRSDLFFPPNKMDPPSRKERPPRETNPYSSIRFISQEAVNQLVPYTGPGLDPVRELLSKLPITLGEMSLLSLKSRKLYEDVPLNKVQLLCFMLLTTDSNSLKELFDGEESDRDFPDLFCTVQTPPPPPGDDDPAGAAPSQNWLGIETAVEKSSKAVPGELYLHIKDIEEGGPGEEIKKWEVGHTSVFERILGVRKNKPEEATDGLLIIMTDVAKALDASQFSAFPDEGTVFLPALTKFDVTSVSAPPADAETPSPHIVTLSLKAGTVGVAAPLDLASCNHTLMLIQRWQEKLVKLRELKKERELLEKPPIEEKLEGAHSGSSDEHETETL